MKGAIKFIMISVGLLLIGIAVAAIVFREQAAGLARARIARKVSHVFGTEADLARISVAPLKRALVLHELVVNNPPEFKAGNAVRCRRLSLVPDWRTVFQQTLTIHEMRLEGTEIGLRYETGRGTNLGRLAQHALDLAETDPPGRRLRVERLVCEEARLRLDSNLTPKSPIPLRLAAFDVENLEKGEGISAAKLSSILMRSLVLEVVTLKGLLRPVAGLLREELGSG